MGTTQELLSSKWQEIKGEILKRWGQLTDKDLDSTKGNLTSLAGILQQKAALSKEEAARSIGEIVSGVAKKANQNIDDIKDKLKH